MKPRIVGGKLVGLSIGLIVFVGVYMAVPVLCHVCCLSVLRAEDVVRTPGPPWVRSFDEAQQKARAESKDLLLVFTGHGWCSSCDLLDREVFQEPKFVQEADRSFVFVELDFTFGESESEAQRERVYRDLQKRYLAPTVPTIVLVDREGAPYAFFDGYKEGTGPREMLARLDQARRARIERDREFAAAAKSVGRKRAELLHAGLQAVNPLLGSHEDRGDDPLLTFFSTVVSEIRRLDTGDSGHLRAIYDARQERRDAVIGLNKSLFDRLKELDRKDSKEALAFLDDKLKRIWTPDVRWRLEFSRQVYLEWDHQYAAALENARRLLGEANRTPEQREELLGRESFNLWNLGRIEEALAQHDRRMRDAQGCPEKQLRLLRWNADLSMNHRKKAGLKPAVRIEASRKYREASPPNSEDWLTATFLLALQLKWEGDYREALKLQRELIEADPSNLMIRLDAAESHLALGEGEAAQRMIREVEALLPVNPKQEFKKQHANQIRARIAEVLNRSTKQAK